MPKLFILLMICFVMSFSTIAVSAPATCQEKVLDTVTVQGKYIGYNSSEFRIILEIDGLSDYFGIMASEEEAKKSFGENHGANVEVTYNVEQIFFEEGETCYRHEVFVSGRVLSDSGNQTGGQENNSSSNVNTGNNTIPMKVTIHEKPFNTGSYSGVIKYIDIISIVDSLIIENVIINRGNVKSTDEELFKQKKYPVELIYGKSLKVNVSGSVNILEIQIMTNHGDWVFNP